MNKWISVEFALPSKQGMYMVFDGFPYVAFYKRFKNGKIKWYAPLGGCCINDVSHWMPLPAAPGDEK